MKRFQRLYTPRLRRFGVALGLLGMGWGLLGACTTTRGQQKKDEGVHWLKKANDPPPVRLVTQPVARPVPVRSVEPVRVDARWSSAPLAHAFLLNGGAQPQLNFYSHVLYLRMMLETLQGRGLSSRAITVFSSDGNDPSEDLMVLRSRNMPGANLFAYTPESRFFAVQPKLVNTQIQGTRLWAANHDVLRDQTRKVADEVSSEDPRPVLVFVTDHGTQNRRASSRNHFISLWRDNLDVQSYHRMLEPFGKRRVISVMSQCFSGSFAWSIYPQPSQLNVPTGDRCGFFATTADRPAYGCFADTRLGDSVGHAYRFILAMKKAKTFDEAHRMVLLTDRTPDVPLRSSDSYLRSVLEAEAREQRVTLTTLTDRLLRRYAAKRDPATRADQEMILAITRRFDLPRPVSITASHEQQKVLQKRHEWWKNVESQWQSLFRTARDYHLKRWYAQNPEMQRLVRGELRRLAQHTQATPTLARLLLPSSNKTQEISQTAVSSSWDAMPWSQERIACVREPYRGGPQVDDSGVGERLRDGFLRYVRSVPGLESRIKQMRQKEQEMHRYVFWLQIQSAALLRIDHLLYRMAGRFLLENDPRPEVQAYRDGLARLVACEQTSLGPKRASSVAEKPFSPMKSPPLPSWLGIQFRPLHGAMGLPKGAVLVRLVGVGSPAEKAGLRVGDTVVDVAGLPLQEPYEVRERVMLADADQPLPITVLRAGKSLALSLQLQRMTTEPQLKHPPVLGQSIRSWMTVQTFPRDPRKPYAREALPSLTKDTTLFFFWATWCGPCKHPLPKIRQWQQIYGPKGLKVVAVSAESLQVLEDWLKKHPLTMPFAHVSDPNGFFSAQFRIRATPTFALLHKGRVKIYQVGAYNIAGMEKIIDSIFQAPSAP